MSETRSYPRHAKTDAGDIEFRLMSRADEPAVLAFAQKLPTHDLLFLPRNISQPKVLSVDGKKHDIVVLGHNLAQVQEPRLSNSVIAACWSTVICTESFSRSQL